MGDSTNIVWCDKTFNPWEGCQKVGPGCDHCYAETRNARFGGGTAPNWGPGAPRRRTSRANWRKPLAWDREAAATGVRPRVFCASLADVLDPDAPDGAREDLGRLVVATPSLYWLFLTKRIGNAAKMLPAIFPDGVPANVWLGITVVNQAEADRDIPKLRDVKRRHEISVAFLSIEPMIGPVDLTRDMLLYDECPNWIGDDGSTPIMDPSTGMQECCSSCDFTGIGDLAIDWVIAGGESGPGARPSHPDWYRSLRDQCADAGVPYLFKQHGEWGSYLDRDRDDPDWRAPYTRFEASKSFAFLNHAGGCGFHGDRLHVMQRIGKKAAGRLLDDVQHDGMPVCP